MALGFAAALGTGQELAFAVNRNTDIWLVSSHNYPLLAKALELAVLFPDLASLHLLVFAEESGAQNLAEMLQLAFIEAAYQHRLFHTQTPLPNFQIHLANTASLLQTLPPPPQENQRIWLVPENLACSQDQEIDIEVSVQQSIFLDALDPAWNMDEGFLLELQRSSSLFSMRQRDWYIAEARLCAQRLLALSAEQDLTQQPLLAARLQSLKAMQLLHLEPELKMRSEIQQAILRLHANPNDRPALAVLDLFQRDFVCGENPGHEDKIHVYPAVTDWCVTVVLVTYNRLALLQRAVQAILNQTSSRWRLLILDHGSTDGSGEWLKTVAQEAPAQIKILHAPENQGPEAVGKLYQTLLAEVETELVLIQSDDDWLYPTHLEKVLNFWQRHPWLALVATAYQLLSPEGEVVYQYGPFYPLDCIADPRTENLRLALMRICPQAAVIRKSLLKTLCSYDTLFAQPEAEYAVWDFAITAMICAQSETGILEEVLSAFTVSEKTAFYGRNFVEHQLKLLQSLIAVYNRLWGEASFPREVAQNTLQTQLNLAVQHFQMALHSASDPASLPQILKSERQVWELLITLRQEFAHITRSGNANMPEVYL